MSHFSRQSIGAEALEKAHQTLNSTVQKIDNTLHKVESASRNMCWNVEHHLDNPDAMAEYCRRFMLDNPNVMGCAIAFVPNYYRAQGKGEFYMAYWHRLEKGSQDLFVTYDPTVMEPMVYGQAPYVASTWFFIPMKANSTVWVRPHVPGEKFLSSIVSCSTPIHDHTGRPVGVFAVDLPIAEISRTVLATKPFPNSYSMMLGVQGTYLIHPDSTKLFNKLVSETLKEEPDPRLDGLVESMLAGESGTRQVTFQGQECYVFYEGVNEGHWSACIVCPESDIFAAHQQLIETTIIVILIGLILSFLFCVFFANRQLLPLTWLEKSAKRIADNDFSERIPGTTRQDEIGDLQNSFRSMQRSLEQKIKEANDLSADLREHGAQLRAAYEKAKMVDRMKSSLLHKHADQMVTPASAVDSAVSEIRRKQDTLMPQDMEALSKKIEDNVQILNGIVDNMLSLPKEE